MNALPQHLIDLFSATRVAYTNGRDHAEIQPKLAEVGYDPARLDALLAEVDAAETEAEQQDDAKDGSSAATATLRGDYRGLRKQYVKHVKLARTVFDRGSSAYRRLGLRGDRADAVTTLLSQADEFYRVLGQDAALLGRLSTEVSIDQATVDAQEAALQGVRDRLTARAAAKGGAEDLTQSRDSLADDIEDEWGRFRRRARIALEDQPQLLEVLGISVPS